MADEKKGTILGREPILFMAVIQALIGLTVSFGMTFTADQTASIMVLTGAILALIARSQVTPNVNVNGNPPNNGGQ